jgi:hypothetical protein
VPPTINEYPALASKNRLFHRLWRRQRAALVGADDQRASNTVTHAPSSSSSIYFPQDMLSASQSLTVQGKTDVCDDIIPVVFLSGGIVD